MNTWTFDDLPGWREDARLRSFYGYAFSPSAYYELDAFKSGALEGSEYSKHLRESLAYLVEHRPATTEMWLDVSGTQYYSEDELYGFLAEVYEYFFGEREDQPMPPDPDRPPPSDDPRFWTEWVSGEPYVDEEDEE